VLLWSSTLDLAWNDLPVKPVFLPFIHTVTKYLADFADAPASLTVGQVIPAPRKTGAHLGATARGGTIAVAPSGARVSVETEAGAARRGDCRGVRRGDARGLRDDAAVDAVHAGLHPAVQGAPGDGDRRRGLPLRRPAAAAQRERRAGCALSRRARAVARGGNYQ